jgi:hypothetical protein
MTRKTFLFNVRLVIGVYAVALFIAVALRWIDGSAQNIPYNTFKDLVPIIITLPAAYITYCVQQRLSFLQFLRAAWSNVVKAVNGAIIYLQTERPTREEHIATLMALRVAIDEVRGIYKNVAEDAKSETHGFYPASPLLAIYQKLETRPARELTDADREDRAELSWQLFDTWKKLRKVLLAELDRPQPTESDITPGNL